MLLTVDEGRETHAGPADLHWRLLDNALQMLLMLVLLLLQNEVALVELHLEDGQGQCLVRRRCRRHVGGVRVEHFMRRSLVLTRVMVA